ncbi:MAG: hypothetical protein RLZZ162_2419 [Verrucomicrobiota bacterium]
MAANDDTACLAEGKRFYRRQGFEVVIRDARKIDRTDKLTSLNAEASGGGIEPDTFNPEVLRGKNHVH